MNGKRSLTSDEFERARAYLVHSKRHRDVAMFSLLYYTGYRIKEVLSMRMKDLYDENWNVRSRIHVKPRNMKKKSPRPSIPVHHVLRDDLQTYRDSFEKDALDRDAFVIESQKSDSISYTQAYRICKDIFEAVDIVDNVAVHSFRKSFAENIYEKSGGDIRMTQAVMGHSSPMITVRYLSVDLKKAEGIIESI